MVFSWSRCVGEVTEWWSCSPAPYLGDKCSCGEAAVVLLEEALEFLPVYGYNPDDG